jgi:hypothetical protein
MLDNQLELFLYLLVQVDKQFLDPFYVCAITPEFLSYFVTLLEC